MATKPGTTPPVIATGANYTVGPMVGMSTKVLPVAPFTTNGLRPGGDPADASPAEFLNYTIHWIGRWIDDWMSQGSAIAATDTHIVETDADGRTQQRGFDVVEPTDRIVADWRAGNTVGTPAMYLETGGGAGIFVDTAGGNSPAFAASPTGASQGVAIASNSSNPPIQISQQGSGPLFSVVGIGGASGGASISASGTDADGLVLSSASGAPVLLTPKASHPSPTAGRVWAHTPSGKFHVGAPAGHRETLWSTKGGMILESAQASFATPATLPYLVTAPIEFVVTRRYVIRYTVDLARTGTRDVVDQVVAGPFGSPFYGTTVNLFYSGFENERTYSKAWVLIPGFTLTVPVELAIIQLAGTGTTYILNGSITVEGVYD